jgi:hypothetical protein
VTQNRVGTEGIGTDAADAAATAGAPINRGDAKLNRRAFFAGIAATAALAVIPPPVDPVEQFIADMKAEGLWVKFDGFWVLTTETPVGFQTFVPARSNPN